MNVPCFLPTRYTVRSVRQREPNGFALITALLVLVMLTILGLSMFRGFGLQQKIAGNTREKERSLQAAQSGLNYAEWWINQADPQATNLVACTAPKVIGQATDMRLCSNPLANPTDPSTWTAGSAYQPAGMTVSPGGGVTGSVNSVVSDVNYAEAPQVYVAYIGLTLNGSATLYSVTSAGYGGNGGSASVVQSVFSITNEGQCLSCQP